MSTMPWIRRTCLSLAGKLDRLLSRSGLADTSGVTAIEYGLLAALVAVAVVVGVGAVGLNLEAMYLYICNRVVGAIGGGSC